MAEGSLLLIHGVTGLGSAHPKESLEVRCLGAIRLEACGPILSTRPLDVPLNAPFFLLFFPISKDINIVFYGALLVLLSFASVPRASPSVLAPEVNSDRSPRFVQFMVHSFD